jgi:hypothetical protein
LQESYKIELGVESDTWNTLWLIQKTINEGQKKEVPFRIEISSGSLYTTISMTADLVTIGAVVYKIIEYLRKKREQEKPLKITKFSRDVAYAYVLYHLKAVAKVPKAELTSEYRTKDDSYHFEFKETEIPEANRISIFRHIYTISKDFDVRYARKEEFIFH